MKLFGGIESGGTKFVCLVGTDPNHLIQEERFPTTAPCETIDRAAEVFLPYVKNGELAAVGIASFGPLDLDGTRPPISTLPPHRKLAESN
jgi:fructokinase